MLTGASSASRCPQIPRASAAVMYVHWAKSRTVARQHGPGDPKPGGVRPPAPAATGFGEDLNPERRADLFGDLGAREGPIEHGPHPSDESVYGVDRKPPADHPRRRTRVAPTAPNEDGEVLRWDEVKCAAHTPSIHEGRISP